MPMFSAFTPCGVLRLSSKPSPGKLLYEQLKQLYGSSQDAGQPPFDLTQGTHLEASLYARARSLARLEMLIERAGAEGKALTSYELLPLLELDLYLTPGPNDSILTRQQRVAAAQEQILPNTYANMVSGLQGILGSAFLALTVAPHGSTRALTPTAGASTGAGHYADVRVPPKFLQLVDPVTTTGGTSYVAYKNLDTTSAPLSLSVGDYVVVQAENTILVEVVQITGVWFAPPLAAGGTASTQSPPAGTPTWSSGTSFAVGQLVSPATANGFWFECVGAGKTGSTEPVWASQFGQQVTDGTVTWISIGASTTLSAVFQNAHDAGASVILGNVPLESSTQRFCYIVLAGVAAADRDTRRKIDLFMARSARGVSQWAIIAGASTGPGTYTAGPFNAGTPIAATPVDAYP